MGLTNELLTFGLELTVGIKCEEPIHAITTANRYTYANSHFLVILQYHVNIIMVLDEIAELRGKPETTPLKK